MVMDATSADRAPAYTDGTRLPQWLLPDTAPEVVRKMRPDILVIPTLRLDQARAFDHKPPPTANRAQHKVYLLEVGYGTRGT